MSALSDFYYEQAQKALATVDPIPPAPISPLCELGGTQANKRESVGSPYLCDWSMDVRASHRLSDAELVDKMRWELEALKKRERLQRVLEVPTVYPSSEKS
jgi:hypothetical protein